MSLHAARESLGIPRPLSSDLWSSVFGKTSSTLLSDSKLSLPPLGPVDKNATSTRILLHDTQANLERFSARVDTLLNGLSEAKSEVKAVKSLFERDRETLTNDIIDLVNRCQTRIQEALGSPAQSSVLDHFSREICQRLENLDKRLDAIQTLSQTHAQALQTQARAIQAIQEQQCGMLAAVTPLISLLQAVPLHIDSAKNSLLDTLRNQTPSNTSAPQLCISCNPKKLPRKMTLLDNLADPTPPRKRPRTDSMTIAVPNRPSSRSSTQSHDNLRVAPNPLSRSQSTHKNNVTISRPRTPDPKAGARGDSTNPGAPIPPRPVATIYHTPGQQRTLTSNNGPNSQRILVSDKPHMANTENPPLGHPSMVHDLPGQPSAKKRMTLPPLSQNKASNLRQAQPSLSISGHSILASAAQLSKNSNDLKRASTQAAAPHSTKAPIQGPQFGYQHGQTKGRQLKTTMALMPPRRRRSPPKEGRRFIPLLDSDDEDIASP